MYVVAVTVWVKPEFVAPFIEASLDNARKTRREPANVRWDFLQAEDDPTRFLLYEAYTSKDGFTAHQQTPHQVVTTSDTKIVIEWDFKFPRAA
jgi:(4S)-4-hydroxy-5-phosphonooxypentane-2,3-dione isomerase